MNVRPKLRTPITYYGGKQVMARHILPLIPPHKIYTEAFFGGGAIFFSKEPSEVEVINDLNGEIVNFYRILVTDFWRLNELIRATLLSRADYEDAMVVYNHPKLFDPIKRAWAFWVLTNQGYASKIGSWGYDANGSTMVKKIDGKKVEFTTAIRTRLERTQIECNDAGKVIQSRDSKETFHYVDTPYIGSNMGHYSGYTDDQYRDHLQILARVEGKFLLSGYNSEILDQFIKKHKWHVLTFEKQLSASPNKAKRKIEVLVANYPINTTP
jgi:DNA adenine methylase